jgi:hypothetical protein
LLSLKKGKQFTVDTDTKGVTNEEGKLATRYFKGNKRASEFEIRMFVQRSGKYDDRMCKSA